MTLPPELMPASLVLLCLASMLAGFVDSVVGGGGLIQIPALLSLWPQASLPTLFGTNKLSSVWGTLSAALRYTRHVSIPWKITGIAATTAFIGSYLGAWAISHVHDGSLLRPIIPIALAIVAWQIYHHPKTTPEESAIRVSLPIVGIGCFVIGFYDGFFGPGTGSFIIFFLVRFCRFSFLTASASAKFINLTTNFSALMSFAMGGHLSWSLGLLMALFNVAGSQIGSHMAITKGSEFVRRLLLTVVVVLILKTGWDSLRDLFMQRLR